MSNTRQSGRIETNQTTRTSFREGSRVIVYRRSVDDSVTADEQLEALRTAREDYIDRNGANAADLVGPDLPMAENVGEDDVTVAFACAVMPNGLPVVYNGAVHSEDSTLETAVEAASYAEQFAALTNTDIDVHEPDESTRTVEVGELNGVPGLEGDEESIDPAVEEAAHATVPRTIRETSGGKVDKHEHMDHLGKYINSHKHKPFGALHREMDWYRGTTDGTAAHGFFTDLSMVSGWQKWDSYYENRYSHITHDWSQSETGNVDLSDWGPKGTSTGTVSKELSVGGTIGKPPSLDVGMSWAYTQPDVYDEDKSEPTDQEAKWKLTVKYNTSPRNSTVNWDPVSLATMDEASGSGKTKIATTHYRGYWTSMSSLYAGKINASYDWKIHRE